MIRSRLARALKDDSGLSFTELLIGMILTSIMLVMAGTMFVQMTKITATSNQMQSSTRIASTTAKSITNVIGTATNLAKQSSATPDAAIVSGSATSLTIYSYTNANPNNPAPTKVTYTLNTSGKLTETRCTATASGAYWTFSTCGSTETRTLATTLRYPGPGVADLFTYRDANGTAYAIGTGSLTDSQRAAVGSITVQVTANPLNATGNAAVITNTVVLRNIGLGSTS